jgi:hypothetical protein
MAHDVHLTVGSQSATHMASRVGSAPPEPAARKPRGAIRRLITRVRSALSLRGKQRVVPRDIYVSSSGPSNQDADVELAVSEKTLQGDSAAVATLPEMSTARGRPALVRRSLSAPVGRPDSDGNVSDPLVAATPESGAPAEADEAFIASPVDEAHAAFMADVVSLFGPQTVAELQSDRWSDRQQVCFCLAGGATSLQAPHHAPRVANTACILLCLCPRCGSWRRRRVTAVHACCRS